MITYGVMDNNATFDNIRRTGSYIKQLCAVINSSITLAKQVKFFSFWVYELTFKLMGQVATKEK